MIVYIAPQKNWIWTSRIKSYLDKNDKKYKIFEPKKGLINLFKNFCEFLIFFIFRRESSVIISFASTNGYLASFIPFLKYTLIIHGTDVLSKDEKVLKRSRRAVSRANKIYIASASRYVSELLKIECCQKYEWGLSDSDFENSSVFKSRPSNNPIIVAGIRHIRSHYNPFETIDTFVSLEKKLGHVNKLHFCGLPFKKDLDNYKEICKKNGLDIELVGNLGRSDFLFRLSLIDIGISLAKSDLFGGPILEMLYFGNYVIVSDHHPLLSYKQEYQLDGLISISNLNYTIFDFSVNGRKERSNQFESFSKFLNFEKSMDELLNEYI